MGTLTVLPGEPRSSTTRTVLAVGGAVTVKTPVCTSLQPVLLSVIGPVTAPAGTVVTIWVPLFVMIVAATLLLNLTAVTPFRFVLVIVTVVPAGPLAGLMPLTVGQAVVEVTVKTGVATLLHPALLIVIAPLAAPVGTMTMICVSVSEVIVAVTLLVNFTLLTPVKFAPVMVTLLPTAPLVGLMPLMVGHAVSLVADWVAVKVWPAMVIVPCRALPLLLGATV